MKNIINVGDMVTYRGGFGGDPPKRAKVVGLTLTDEPREKYGQEVLSVDVQSVKANRVLFDLDDGHWCYSDQIVFKKG
jgi:hypothetical protein